MANEEHLKILKMGVNEWNKWRTTNNILPILSHADLGSINLIGADLKNANLFHANLSHTNLSYADLSFAELSFSNLFGANLSHANLTNAFLVNTSLTNVILEQANLKETLLFETIFSNVDLSLVLNLDKCKHIDSSTIDHQTLRKSKNLPLEFLRGCGLPDILIENIPALFYNSPIQFYSCFISYSNNDQEFAEKLYSELQNMGIRCWFAPEDMKVGDKIRTRIDESIRIYDKLLLIISSSSIKSKWVEHEVEQALSKENKNDNLVLFPLRLDDEMFNIEAGWITDVQTRHVGDFCNWKNHDSFKKSFERLLEDLKPSLIKQ